MNKRCTKCKIVKDMSDFYQRKAAPDERMHECKACRKFRRPKQISIHQIVRTELEAAAKSVKQWVAACLRCKKKITVTVDRRLCEPCRERNSQEVEGDI